MFTEEATRASYELFLGKNDCMEKSSSDLIFLICDKYNALFPCFEMDEMFLSIFLVCHRPAPNYWRWGDFLWAGCIRKNTSWCLTYTIIHSVDLWRTSCRRKDTERASWFVKVRKYIVLFYFEPLVHPFLEALPRTALDRFMKFVLWRWRWISGDGALPQIEVWRDSQMITPLCHNNFSCLSLFGFFSCQIKVNFVRMLS